MIEISQDTIAVVEAIENSFDGSLLKKNDFSQIIELGATYTDGNPILEMIICGKMLYSLYRTLNKSSQSNDNDLVGVHREFEHNLEKFRSILHQLSEFFDESTQKRFEDIYFQMTKGAVLNLLDLAHDFARFKDLQNQVQK